MCLKTVRKELLLRNRFYIHIALDTARDKATARAYRGLCHADFILAPRACARKVKLICVDFTLGEPPRVFNTSQCSRVGTRDKMTFDEDMYIPGSCKIANQPSSCILLGTFES